MATWVVILVFTLGPVGALAYINNMHIVVYAILLVFVASMCIIYLRYTSRQDNCADCGKRKFSAQVDIELKTSRKDRKQTRATSTMQIDANVVRETFKIVRELKKPIKKNWIFQVVTIIIGILGIFNHEVIINYFTSLFSL